MNILKKIVGRAYRSYQQKNQDPAMNINCSEFEVNNWVISDFIVHKLIPIVGTHPYPIGELNLMVAAVCRLKPAQIFEWGSNIGKSGRIFYETAKYFRLSVEIHSIDLPDDIEHQEHPKSQRGIFVKGLKEVTLHYGDGLTKTLEIYGKTSKVSAPLIFIDGDHSYESVRRELEGIIQNIPGANILLHDTFYQSKASGYNIGPHKAIADTLSTMPHNYKLMSTSMGLPGMTLLYQF